jgi:crotonobetaine/carnitine-CoA ligase
VPGRAPAAGDLAQIAYTSGTTARPKGVMQTHYAYVRTGIEMARALEYTPEDRQFVVLPLYHGGAVNTQILPSLAARSTAALLPRFSASRFWSQVKRYDPTQLGLMHGMQSMLLTRAEVPEEKGHRIRFSWGTATEPIERAFRERFGIPSLTTYGLSECSFVTSARPGQPYRAGWCGTPGMDDMEVRILDPVTLEEVPLEETGIIAVRNPCVMVGYYQQPEETARALRDGWLITGDLGALDAGGNLYFRGKHKHVIRRSGENISGEEVEATVLAHPGVAACTASAVPDPVREEEVKVVVAVHPGATVTEEEIRTWVGARLARFKVPRYVELVS